MDETGIRYFSLTRLMEICGLHPDDMIFDGCVIIRHTPEGYDRAIELLRYPTRIDALVVAFCAKGRLCITSDLTSHKLTESTLYIHLPGSIIQVSVGQENRTYAIACEEAFFSNIGVDYKFLSQLVPSIRECPLITLEESERQELVRALEDIFRERDAGQHNPYSIEIMRQLLKTLIYRLGRIVYRSSCHKPHGVKTASKNRNEEYFERFMSELAKHYMHERSVGFYAGQLHLTPKYLTTVIRRTSGRPAVTWIDDYVVLEAKNLLRYSTMSIQEIAYSLNFPNQSFFGRYFKNHTGLTPSAYRANK